MVHTDLMTDVLRWFHEVITGGFRDWWKAGRL